MRTNRDQRVALIKMKSLLWISAIFIAVWLISACGGNDQGTEDTLPAASPTTLPTDTVEPITMEPPRDASPTASPTTLPTDTVEPITMEPPRIAFIRQVFSEEGFAKSEIFLVGVEGGEPTRLLEGEHNLNFGQCPNSPGYFYLSDEEVPNEQFLYFASADENSVAKKITEEPSRLVACVSGGSLVWVVDEGPTPRENPYLITSLKHHNPANGVESTILPNVDWRFVYPSPNGDKIVFVGGLDYSGAYDAAGEGSLQVLDLDSDEVRQLEQREANRTYDHVEWSPDGQSMAYLVSDLVPHPIYEGRITDTYHIYAREVQEGKEKLLYSVVNEPGGRAPRFRLSPSGDWLLVFQSWEEPQESELILINVESGDSRSVVKTTQYRVNIFHSRISHETPWAANEDSFVYGVGNTVYLQSVNGDIQELATLSDDSILRLGSFGWSPDGRYIGFACTGRPDNLCQGRSIFALDTQSGELLTVVKREDEIWLKPRWWR